MHAGAGGREEVAVVFGIAVDEGRLDVRDEVAGPVVLAVERCQVGLIVRGVRREADTLELRQPFLPIGLVLFELPVLRIEAGHVGEWTRADRGFHCFGDGILDLRPDVLGDDRLVEDVVEAGGVHAGEVERHGHGIDGFDGVEIAVVSERRGDTGWRRQPFRALEEHKGKGHVFGVECFAVRPGDAVTERDGEDSVVFIEGRFSGEPWRQFVGQQIANHQRFVHAGVGGPAAAAAFGEEWVEVAHPRLLLILRNGQQAIGGVLGRRVIEIRAEGAGEGGNRESRGDSALDEATAIDMTTGKVRALLLAHGPNTSTGIRRVSAGIDGSPPGLPPLLPGGDETPSPPKSPFHRRVANPANLRQPPTPS